MFSITPFSPLGSLEKSSTESMSPKSNKVKPTISHGQDRPPSDEDVEIDEEDFGALTCFTGLLPNPVSPTRARLPGMSYIIQFDQITYD